VTDSHKKNLTVIIYYALNIHGRGDDNILLKLFTLQRNETFDSDALRDCQKNKTHQNVNV